MYIHISIYIIYIYRRIEPLENLKTLVLCTDNASMMKEYSKKVAENLYNFMVSYHKDGLI